MWRSVYSASQCVRIVYSHAHSMCTQLVGDVSYNARQVSFRRESNGRWDRNNGHLREYAACYAILIASWPSRKSARDRKVLPQFQITQYAECINQQFKFKYTKLWFFRMH